MQFHRETKPAAKVRSYADRERLRTKPGLCTSALEPKSVFEIITIFSNLSFNNNYYNFIYLIIINNYLQHHITAFSGNKFKNHCIQNRDALQHCKGAKNYSLMLQQLRATGLLEIPGDGTFHAGHPSDCLQCCLGVTDASSSLYICF